MYLEPGILFAQLLGGLSRAMILFLLSSGLSLTFGVMNILNFAHATLWLLGGYITFSIFTYLGAAEAWAGCAGEAILDVETCRTDR